MNITTADILGVLEGVSGIKKYEVAFILKWDSDIELLFNVEATNKDKAVQAGRQRLIAMNQRERKKKEDGGPLIDLNIWKKHPRVTEIVESGRRIGK